ncbi:MAG TPA: 6-bladed beta-propeller [Gemmatimonadaceae bacterium]|nr:6-bladed beta-propeller [Gemmatimonadaceae bacterium]
MPFDSVFTVSSWTDLLPDSADPIGEARAVAEWNGLIALADGIEGNVKIFRNDGRLAETIGRPGNGPGEFKRPNALLPLPDGSLGVYDFSRQTFTIFARDGTYRRAVAVPGAILGRVSLVDSSGTLLMPGRYFDLPPDSVRTPMHVVDSAGNRLHSFGMLPPIIHRGEGSFELPSGLLVGNVWVWAARTGNQIRFLDRTSGRTWSVPACDEVYKPIDWEPMAHAAAASSETSNWMRQQMWLTDLIPVDTAHFLVTFTRWNVGPTAAQYWYALTDVTGHTIWCAGPTPVRLYTAEHGRAIGLETDSTGSVRLGRFALREPL